MNSTTMKGEASLTFDPISDFSLDDASINKYGNYYNNNDLYSQSDINISDSLNLFSSDFIIESTIQKGLEIKIDNKSARKNFFNVEHNARKKRGRPQQSVKRRKPHTSLAKDNIERKIQIHFLNFTISLINDIISQLPTKKIIRFKNLNFEKKSDVTSSHINILKNFTIDELLKYMGISTKYKCKEDINQKYLEKLYNYTLFENLFRMKYTDLYKYYYNNKQPFKEIILSEQKIILSDETKSFYNLIEKNKEIKEEIIKKAETLYSN